MRRQPSAKVASVGLTQVQLAFESRIGWLFRNQPTEDYGIDAHVEVVDGKDVRGQLLAVQVKSGTSWFSEPTPGGWWFRPDVAHVQYWINHSLPVAVVLYHPDRELSYWQLVNRTTLAETKTGGWKLLVPEEQVLDEQAVLPLTEATQGDPYVLRVRELQLAKPWMEMLVGGTRLVIDMEEWINKTSGRGSISIGVDREDGNDPEPLVTWRFLAGPASYTESAAKLFAWADLDVHEETYETEEPTDYWTSELRPSGIRPYKNGAGEIDYFRLELSLNELGRAFLVVDKFATEGDPQLTQ
jgi:hypothetical protein